MGVRRTPARVAREARGSAAVEFALVLPLLLVVALAIVQVALLAQDSLVLDGVARAGAREAAVTNDDAAIREACAAAAAGLSPDRLEIRVARDGGAGSPVSVDVDYRAVPAVPFVGWLFPSAISMSATATMRQEFE